MTQFRIIGNQSTRLLKKKIRSKKYIINNIYIFAEKTQKDDFLTYDIFFLKEIIDEYKKKTDWAKEFQSKFTDDFKWKEYIYYKNLITKIKRRLAKCIFTKDYFNDLYKYYRKDYLK
jgi:hypothetical protein